MRTGWNGSPSRQVADRSVGHDRRARRPRRQSGATQEAAGCLRGLDLRRPSLPVSSSGRRLTLTSCFASVSCADMKRDMELIRLLLLQQETGEAPPELNSYNKELVVYNAALAIGAGLLDGSVVPNESGQPSGACILGLTWAGHDFLDSTRDPKIWKLAKEKLLIPGISWSFSLLVEYLKMQAHQKIFGPMPPPQ
jgi:hypothetical protein